MSNIGVWEDAEPGVRRKIMPPGASLMMMEVHFEEGPKATSMPTRMNSCPTA